MSDENESRPSARTSRRESLSRWLTRPQTMIALSAVLLSVCGLFIAVYETTLLRRHQRASVWPHVEVHASLTTERVRLMVQNTGVGPAQIRAAAVMVNGERQGSWEDMIRSIHAEPGRIDAYYSMINGRVLPAGTEQQTIFALATDDGGAASALVPALRREVLDGNVDIEVCYCSVYDECWTASMQDLVRRQRGLESPRSRQIDNCRDEPTSGI